MKTRTSLAVLLAIVVGLAAVPACGQGVSEPGPTASATGGFPARTVMAGSVQVLITPVQLDDKGAVFDISMETHSGDLGSDLDRTARLEVNGTAWLGASWVGDPPGGHHREGSLSFQPGGPASGTAVLTIGGFPGPVEASWTLDG